MSKGSSGSVETDMLFLGLTRAPMFLGVNTSFVGLNAMVNVIVFLNGDPPNLVLLFLLLPSVHMVGFILSYKEPLFMELFIVRMQKLSRCPNRIYHGANSYDSF